MSQKLKIKNSATLECGLSAANKGTEVGCIHMGVNDINSLAHSKWNCKYHIVFAPKYRRMVFYGQKKHEVGKILRKLCEWKGVEVLNAEACPDHIHMLLSIPPKYSVSKFMGYLKGRAVQCCMNSLGN